MYSEPHIYKAFEYKYIGLRYGECVMWLAGSSLLAVLLQYAILRNFVTAEELFFAVLHIRRCTRTF